MTQWNFFADFLLNIFFQIEKVPSLSYPLIAEAAVLSGPQCFRKFGPFMM